MRKLLDYEIDEYDVLHIWRPHGDYWIEVDVTGRDIGWSFGLTFSNISATWDSRNCLVLQITIWKTYIDISLNWKD